MLSVGLWFEEDAHLLHVEIKAAAGFSSEHPLYVKAQLLPDPKNELVKRTKMAPSKTPVWNESLSFPVWYHELFYKKLILILKEKQTIKKNLTRGMVMLSSLGEAAKSRQQCTWSNYQLQQIVFWGTSDEEVLHLGFLFDHTKRGRKHLCVLTPRKFNFYKHKRDSIPATSLDLCDAKVVSDAGDGSPPRNRSKEGNKHGFSIVTVGPNAEADRTFHFDAENEEDRKAWITAIEKAIANLACHKPPPPSEFPNILPIMLSHSSAEGSGLIPATLLKNTKGDDDVVYSGWMKKVSGVLKAKRKRWFVLSQSVLSYWKKAPFEETGSREEPIAQIPLYHARLTPQPFIDKYAFSVHPYHYRSYTLICKDANDMNSWVKYIQDAIDALSSMAKESVDPSVISKLLSSFSAGENEESLGKRRKEDISGRLVSYLPHLCVKRLVQRDLMRGTPPSSDPHTWQQQLTAMLPSQSEAEVVTLPDAAVAVMDISGFTRLNEILAAQGKGAAEQVSQHINTYFGQLLEIVFQHGGDCIKFAGDALLVVFSDNIPLPPVACLTPRPPPRFIVSSSPASPPTATIPEFSTPPPSFPDPSFLSPRSPDEFTPISPFLRHSSSASLLFNAANGTPGSARELVISTEDSSPPMESPPSPRVRGASRQPRPRTKQTSIIVTNSAPSPTTPPAPPPMVSSDKPPLHRAVSVETTSPHFKKRPSSTRRSLNLGPVTPSQHPRLSTGGLGVVHPKLMQSHSRERRSDSTEPRARSQSRSTFRHASSLLPIPGEDDVTNDEEEEFTEDEDDDDEEDEGDETDDDSRRASETDTSVHRKISSSSNISILRDSFEIADSKSLAFPTIPENNTNVTPTRRTTHYRRREREPGCEHVNTLRAVQCMLEVQEKCGQYLADSVSLTLHIGISCGDVYGFHVGGEQNEWEFLVAGTPFRDLGSAVDAGTAGDVIMSARAWALVKDRCVGTEVNPEEPQAIYLVGASAKKGEKVYVCDKYLRIISQGTIEFKGSVDFSPLPHLGVVLTQPVGNCDGSRDSVSYFPCEPNFGLFWLESALTLSSEVPVARGGGEVKVTSVHQPTPRTLLPGFPIGYSPKELAMHPLISAAMRCYIPRMIHDEGRELLAAENRKASVIFVNLRLGLDQTVSETKLGKLLLRVHAVLRTMQQIIINNDGYRRQFLMDDKGCVLIVVFGVPPYAHEKDCYRTVKCALELRQALAEAKVSHSIGIATGLVYSGTVGFSRRREHAVVGDTVNLAARLCGKARHWEILTDQTTAETVDNLIRMEARGEIQVKGKQLKQAIFAPLALSKQDNLGEQRGETTGRSFELNTFRSHFATLQKGTGATLFLTGLPGIGKTQLCRTFYGICSNIEHLEVLYVAGDGTEMSTPFSLWSKLLEQMIHLPEHKGTPERDAKRRQKVIDFLRTKNVSVPNAIHLLDVLFPNIRLGKVTNVDEDITSEKLFKQMNSFIIMILQQNFQQKSGTALVSKQVLYASGFAKKKKHKVVTSAVWLIDDAHVIDDLSWVLLRKVMELIMSKQLPILLVISARPPKGLKPPAGSAPKGWNLTFQELSERKEYTSWLRLDNMNLTDLKRIVIHRLGCRNIPTEVMEFLMRMSLGNPLYAIELANHLVHEKHLRIRLDREMVCTTPLHKLATIELPTSLQALLVQQIDALPVMMAYICKIASVFGTRPFPIPLLSAMMKEEGLDETDLEKSLRSLHDSRLLERCAETNRDTLFRISAVGDNLVPMSSYQFLSPMMANTCYSLLLFKQRIKLHLSAADTMTLLRKDRESPADDTSLELIIDHRFKAVQNFIQGGGTIPGPGAVADDKKSTFPPGLAEAIDFLLKTPGYTLEMLQKGTRAEVGMPVPELAPDVRIHLDLVRQEWIAACEYAGLTREQETKLLSRLLLLHPAQVPEPNPPLSREGLRTHATKSLLDSSSRDSAKK